MPDFEISPSLPLGISRPVAFFYSWTSFAAHAFPSAHLLFHFQPSPSPRPISLFAKDHLFPNRKYFNLWHGTFRPVLQFQFPSRQLSPSWKLPIAKFCPFPFLIFHKDQPPTSQSSFFPFHSSLPLWLKAWLDLFLLCFPPSTPAEHKHSCFSFFESAKYQLGCAYPPLFLPLTVKASYLSLINRGGHTPPPPHMLVYKVRFLP